MLRAARRVLGTCAVFALLVAAGLAIHLSTRLSRTSSERYLMGVFDRQRMLAATKGEPRILLVGGSGMGLSVSAETLTRELGIRVVNTGVQAGIGFRNIWHLYEPYLDPTHDIIVLSPELSFFGGDEGFSLPLCDVVFLSKRLDLIARYPLCTPVILGRLWEEGRYLFDAPPPETGVYRRTAFNESGDVVSHLGLRHAVPDFSHYDLPGEVTLGSVRDYVAFVRKRIAARGFEVVGIAPLAPQSTCNRYSERIRLIVAEFLQVTSNPAIAGRQPKPVFCFPDASFFDGPDHLNARGRAAKTEIFRAHLALLPLPRVP